MTNARLIAELRRSREDLAGRADTERALREINVEISMMREPTAILHRIAAEGARLLGTERVSINIPNDPEAKTGWTWYTPTEIGVDPWSAEDSIGIDEGICGLAITERRTVITGDYLNDTRFIHKPGPDRYTEDEGLPSAIAVPIFDARRARRRAARRIRRSPTPSTTATPSGWRPSRGRPASRSRTRASSSGCVARRRSSASRRRATATS